MRCETLFKLIFGFAVCTFLSLLGIWLWLALKDPSQRSTAVSGGVMSAIFGSVFLWKFAQEKRDSRHQSLDTKLIMTLAEHAQWKKGQAFDASATKSGHTNVLPAAWFSKQNSNNASQSWFRRHIHVFMFLSFLAVALKLQCSIVFAMPGGFLAIIMISILAFLPGWIILMSLAMMPFGFNSDRSFRISDLMLLTASAAVILPFFASQGVGLFGSFIDSWLLYYQCVMSVFGVAVLVRTKIKTLFSLPQSLISNS